MAQIMPYIGLALLGLGVLCGASFGVIHLNDVYTWGLPTPIISAAGKVFGITFLIVVIAAVVAAIAESN